MGLRERLAGRRVLVTGVTGFVGEALLERILSDLPDTAVVAVVRPRGGRDGAARMASLLAKPAFAALRARLAAETGLDEKAACAALLADRVQVLEGDLDTLPPFPPDLDVVIHCAGEVSFDPPIDDGFASNVGGVQALLRAVHASGSRPHLVHVSTAYVAGLRSGHVPEGRLAHTVDWRTEQAAAERARGLAEDASRTPEQLAGFRGEAEAEHARAGLETVARDAERRRLAWVRTRLVDAGRERARTLGWTDCYTFTKALGERYVEEAREGLALSVVRPSIIESALARPFPGWIEGFKMAEPLILAYGRGELPDFPASPDGIIDIIPVDLVVNATLAVAAHPPAAEAPAYYHLSSGYRNPLLFRDLYTHVRSYFQDAPLIKRGLGPIAVPVWDFAGSARIERRLGQGERAVAVAGRALDLAPRSTRVRRAADDLDRTDARLAFLRRYMELYRAYTQAEIVYVDEATRALYETLEPADQESFPFDPAAYGWRHYLEEVHCPSVTSGLRALSARPTRPRQRASHQLTGAGGVLAVFDLDGTLMSTTVVESYLLLRLAGDAGSARLREVAGVARALPGYLRAERTDRGRLIRSVYGRYAGADPAAVERLVDDTVGDELLRRVNPAAIRRVREHRAAGHRTVLLTGAIEPLTRPLAPLFDTIMSVRLAVGPDGRYTGRLESAPLVGDARAAWLRQHARLTGADLGGSWAYADSQSDLPMLRAVGHPVAVNADLALLRVARKGKWATEDWPTTPGTTRLAAVGGPPR